MADLKQCDKCGKIGKPGEFARITAGFSINGGTNYRSYGDDKGASTDKGADYCQECAIEAADNFQSFLESSFVYGEHRYRTVEADMTRVNTAIDKHFKIDRSNDG